MERTAIATQIRQLIAQNQTRDALEFLSQFQFSAIDREIIMLNNRYNKIAEEERLGTISRQEANQDYNKINVALLELAEKIKQEAPPVVPPTPASTSPVAPTAAASSGNALKYLGLASLILVVIFSIFYLINRSNRKVTNKKSGQVQVDTTEAVRDQSEAVITNPGSGKTTLPGGETLLHVDLDHVSAFDRFTTPKAKISIAVDRFLNEFRSAVINKEVLGMLAAIDGEAKNFGGNAGDQARKANEILYYFFAGGTGGRYSTSKYAKITNMTLVRNTPQVKTNTTGVVNLGLVFQLTYANGTQEYYDGWFLIVKEVNGKLDISISGGIG